MEEAIKDHEPRTYEVAVIMINDTDEPQFGATVKIMRSEGPKQVPLAYPIKKHTSGFLRVYTIEMQGASAGEVNAGLKGNVAVLRHLMVTPPVITRRNERQAIPAEKPVDIAAAVKPARAESVSNEALEEALEKILENEPK